MENIAIDLAKNSKLPWFQVDSSSVNIIQTPKDFHDSIIDGITTAKERIVLASLYLGSDETEIVSMLLI
jgi:CDP-diacylglycerol--glycerol-3-phosphate 3-phosphatidyltransferase